MTTCTLYRVHAAVWRKNLYWEQASCSAHLRKMVGQTVDNYQLLFNVKLSKNMTGNVTHNVMHPGGFSQISLQARCLASILTIFRYFIQPIFKMQIKVIEKWRNGHFNSFNTLNGLKINLMNNLRGVSNAHFLRLNICLFWGRSFTTSTFKFSK